MRSSVSDARTDTLLNKTANTPQTLLTSYPDSLRLRIKTAGGVPNGNYNIRIQGNGPNGTPVHERFVNVNVGFVGITSNNNEIPKEYALFQNYPNPFNPTTNIIFHLPESGDVSIKIYDVRGKLVNDLLNRELAAGSHNIDWNAADYPSGVYFYKIAAGNFTSVKKMVLIK